MTTSTGTSADRTTDRKHSTIACRAMDSAVRAARYTSYSRDLGTFDPIKASRLRRNFDQYKRSVLLRRSRVPSDAALLDSIDRLIDSGDIAGVQNAADRWLGVL